MDIISDYVFTYLQSISTDEKEGFKRMFKELNPEITKISPPPGATRCGEPFVENIYITVPGLFQLNALIRTVIFYFTTLIQSKQLFILCHVFTTVA